MQASQSVTVQLFSVSGSLEVLPRKLPMYSKLVFFSSAALPGSQPFQGLAQPALVGALGHRLRTSKCILMTFILPGLISFCCVLLPSTTVVSTAGTEAVVGTVTLILVKMVAGFPGEPCYLTIPCLVHASLINVCRGFSILPRGGG